MNFNKKASGKDFIKALVMVLVSIVILMVWIFVFYKFQSFHIDDRKLTNQIIIHKSLNECFSDKYAHINEEDFTEDALNSCLKGLSNDYEVIVKFSTENIQDIIYSNENENIGSKNSLFTERWRFCSIRSTLYCSDLIYPISVTFKNNEYSTQTLRIQTMLT